MYRNKKILIDCEILKSEILQTCPKPVGEWVKNVYEKRDRPISLIAIQEDNFDKRTNINIEQTQPTLASDINSNNQPQTQPTLPQTQQTLASDINSNNQPQIQPTQPHTHPTLASDINSKNQPPTQPTLPQIPPTLTRTDNSSDQVITNQELTIITLKKEYSIQELIQMAKKNEFPKKEFSTSNDRKIKEYTPIFHFFDSLRYFDSYEDMKKKQTIFKCKLCNISQNSTFPNSTNLNKHLKIKCKRNNEYLVWKRLFDERNKVTTALKQNELTLVNFICDSNQSLNVMNNKWFMNIIKNYMNSEQAPSMYSIRNIFLPKVIKNKLFIEYLKNKINLI